jgi:prephenate dehydratase
MTRHEFRVVALWLPREILPFSLIFMPTIHYLGPVGTFSEQAAQMLGNDLLAMMPEMADCSCSFVPQPMLSRVITAIDSPNAFAVVPYYNLFEGLIQETLDLIVEHQLEVLAARQIPIRFAIGGFMPNTPNAEVPNVEVPVFSHPKALAQCSVFLEEHFPAAMCHETSSTSQAVQNVADKKFGLAIARRETLESQVVPVLHDDIGNRQYSRKNCTEFLLVGQKTATGNKSQQSDKVGVSGHPKDKVGCRSPSGNVGDSRLESDSASPVRATRTLIAIIPVTDRVGLLADILGQIAFFGINLLKIHSRPALTDANGPAPQMFYIETDIAADSPELRLCIETLDMRLAKQGDYDDLSRHGDRHKVVRVLGTYILNTV